MCPTPVLVVSVCPAALLTLTWVTEPRVPLMLPVACLITADAPGARAASFQNRFAGGLPQLARHHHGRPVRAEGDHAGVEQGGEARAAADQLQAAAGVIGQVECGD